jgi:hypothetical protein
MTQKLYYLQQLEDVVTDVKVGELGIKNLKVGIVHALEDQRWSL